MAVILVEDDEGLRVLVLVFVLDEDFEVDDESFEEDAEGLLDVVDEGSFVDVEDSFVELEVDAAFDEDEEILVELDGDDVGSFDELVALESFVEVVDVTNLLEVGATLAEEAPGIESGPGTYFVRS